MKRVSLFIKTIEESIKAVETPEKKMEQLEEAKVLAPKYLTGFWLALALGIISVLEATIKLPANS